MRFTEIKNGSRCAHVGFSANGWDENNSLQSPFQPSSTLETISLAEHNFAAETLQHKQEVK